MLEAPNSPEAIRHRKLKVLELYQNGFNESNWEDIFGLHGTSIEAIEMLINKGVLVRQTIDTTGSASGHSRGDIFIVPILENLPDRWKNVETQLEEDVIETYASIVAKRMAFLKELGKPYYEEERYNFALNFCKSQKSGSEILNLKQGNVAQSH